MRVIQQNTVRNAVVLLGVSEPHPSLELIVSLAGGLASSAARSVSQPREEDLEGKLGAVVRNQRHPLPDLDEEDGVEGADRHEAH